MTEWDRLTEPTQLRLAQAALREATINLASYAEALAQEMEAGYMSDRGGCEALRLFATLVRTLNLDETMAAGTA